MCLVNAGTTFGSPDGNPSALVTVEVLFLFINKPLSGIKKSCDNIVIPKSMLLMILQLKVSTMILLMIASMMMVMLTLLQMMWLIISPVIISDDEREVSGARVLPQVTFKSPASSKSKRSTPRTSCS